MTDDRIDRKELIDQIDAEVRKVSEIFRLILKYRERFQPSGIEFSDLRNYLPSDDANRIDWKSSTRLNELYVKEFDEEKDLDTFVILDVSDTMMFGTADKLKSEYCAVLAATIALASVDNGLNVGFGMYGDETTFMTPDGGQKQYHAILHEVANFDNYGGKFDLDQAVSDTVEQVRENTAVFIISDFLEVEGDWKSKVKLANSKFRHVMSMMIRDRRDYKLSDSGNMRLESPDGSHKRVYNVSSLKNRFDEEAAKQEEQIETKLRGAGSGFMKIDTRDSFAAEFASYMDEEGAKW